MKNILLGKARDKGKIPHRPLSVDSIKTLSMRVGDKMVYPREEAKAVRTRICNLRKRMYKLGKYEEGARIWTTRLTDKGVQIERIE